MKRGEIRAGLGMIAAKTDPQNSFSDSSYGKVPWRAGFAVVAEAAGWESVSLELGLFYNQYQFVRAFPTTIVDEKVDRIHVPLTFKVWWFDYLYTGAGVYSSYRVGSVDSGPTLPPKDQQTSAHDVGEQGLEATLGSEFHLDSDLYARIEYRHTFSLTARPLEARNLQSLFFAVLWPVDVNL